MAISVCESMFDVSEYNGKKETKSDSEKAGQWLIKIDEDRPPSILVDSGFLPKFFEMLPKKQKRRCFILS